MSCILLQEIWLPYRDVTLKKTKEAKINAFGNEEVERQIRQIKKWVMETSGVVVWRGVDLGKSDMCWTRSKEEWTLCEERDNSGHRVWT